MECGFRTDGRLVLSRALLIYAGSGRARYATLHGVEAGREPPELTAGVALTRARLARLLSALQAGGEAGSLEDGGEAGYLPGNLLYAGASGMIWWEPVRHDVT